jgi:type III pantothenate kinase
MNGEPNLVAINVGNTRTQVGQFVDGRLARVERLPDAELAAIVECVKIWWREIAEAEHASIVIASVCNVTADRIASAIEDQLSVSIYRIGDDLPAPIGRQLDPETITGVDRLLNAAAAYDTVRQACIVVDAGTAVTVDFVDGEGVFHGGAIAPGAAMQLKSLNEHTEDLPEISFQRPNVRTFGRSTSQAMLNGVFHGIRGMVWKLVEQYAERYGAFPMVIATGGDAPLLFERDELIDRIVPDLTLLGIAAAARYALAGDDADADLRR